MSLRAETDSLHLTQTGQVEPFTLHLYMLRHAPSRLQYSCSKAHLTHHA
jgi:hypothetical protein